MEGGFYLYAIAGTAESAVLDVPGIDGNGDQVEMLPHGDIAAIISRCKADRYDVARANMIAHQRVMEAAMARWPMLPVRFGCIADQRDQIVEKVLLARHGELCDLLEVVADKAELGLKALWADMPAIFAEIVDENPRIKAARNSRRAAVTPAEGVHLGTMVKNALERKKAREARHILRRFDGHWCDRKVNDVFGDTMILNASFLVERRHEQEFDGGVEALEGETNGRVRLKYVGPIPPLNFVEIVVTWE